MNRTIEKIHYLDKSNNEFDIIMYDNDNNIVDTYNGMNDKYVYGKNWFIGYTYIANIIKTNRFKNLKKIVMNIKLIHSLQYEDLTYTLNSLCEKCSNIYRQESIFIDIEIIKNENEELCSICLCEIYDDNTQITKCGHKFHNKCINTWKKYRNTCPNCVQSL